MENLKSVLAELIKQLGSAALAALLVGIFVAWVLYELA